jgi:hypothetical protein
MYRRMPADWGRLPGALLRAILDRRAAQPVPLTYLMALGAGLVLGLVLQLALGWWWWLVALGFVFAVWVVFLATAFSGPARGRGLITEMLMEVSPQRGMARQERQLEATYRSPPFPLYGLDPSWPGFRYLGGYGTSSRKGVQSLELGHGEARTENGPQVRVEVSVDEPPFAGDHIVEMLRRELFHEAIRPPRELEGREMQRWMFDNEKAFESWRPETRKVPIRIDGVPAEFAAVFEGRHWIAQGGAGRLIVKIRARELPIEEVVLVTVRDVEPYIEGHRRLMEDAFRPHDGQESPP